MNLLLERLYKAPLLGDGAMGTLLYARGVPTDHCLEALVAEQPELVAAVHREYASSGADYLTTHSFGANRLRLASYGLENHVSAINRKAVELARDACTVTERSLLIAGNVGPVGKQVDWNNKRESRAVNDAFSEQIGVLAEAGVDFLLFETFSDLEELAIAVQIAQKIGDEGHTLPVMASMSYGENGLTLAGQNAQEVARRLLSLGVDVIGANCSVGPVQMVETLHQMHETAPLTPLSVTPNAGLPVLGEDGILHYPIDARYFAAFAPTYFSMGARIVGGCCGTTPDHIRALRMVMDGLHHS